MIGFCLELANVVCLLHKCIVHVFKLYMSSFKTQAFDHGRNISELFIPQIGCLQQRKYQLGKAFSKVPQLLKLNKKRETNDKRGKETEQTKLHCYLLYLPFISKGVLSSAGIFKLNDLYIMCNFFTTHTDTCSVRST